MSTAVAFTSVAELTQAQAAITGSRFFRGLTTTACAELAVLAQPASFTAGTRIVAAGAPSDALYLIAEGEISVTTTIGHEAEEIISHEGPGAVFGLGASGVGADSLNFTATSPVHAWKWTGASLNQVEAHHPRALEALKLALSIRARGRDLVKSVRRSQAFRNVSQVLVKQLLEAATLLPFRQGEHVCEQGDAGDALYHVVRGEIAIVKHEDGAERTLNVLYAGDTFGEMALLSGTLRVATAVALRDAEVLMIGKAAFDTLMQDSAPFRRSINVMYQERTQISGLLTERADVVWMVNRSAYPVDVLARLLAEEIHRSYGERSLLLTTSPRAAIGSSDGAELVRLPKKSVEELKAAADQAIDKFAGSYVFIFSDSADEELVRRALESRLSRIQFYTTNVHDPFPGGSPDRKSVQYVEVRGPDFKAAKDVVRRGTVRLRLEARPGELSTRLMALSTASRNALGRLGRVTTRRVVGLALSGGAAFGYAHIPLLRGLQRVGIPIDVITGVSFGSMAGALYASRGDEGLEALARSGFEMNLIAIGALATTRFIENWMKRELAHVRVEELDLPFFPVAVDLDRNQERVFRRGNLARATRASCSLPGVFGPTIFEGTRYVDGAMMHNVPASCLQEEGADFVIASNILPARPRRDVGPRSDFSAAVSLVSPAQRFGDTVRALFLLFSATGEQQAELGADVTFSPELAPYYPYDFLSAKQIMTLASQQVEPVLSVAAEKYQALCRGSSRA